VTDGPATGTLIVLLAAEAAAQHAKAQRQEHFPLRFGRKMLIKSMFYRADSRPRVFHPIAICFSVMRPTVGSQSLVSSH